LNILSLIKNSFLKSFAAIIVSAIIYIVLASVLLNRFSTLDIFKNKSSQKSITEGIILPKSDINVNDIFHADPLESSTTSESVLEIRRNISSLVFSSLFREDIEGSLKKDLVIDYEFKEGKELRLVLNPNALWHDGQPVTSDDVIYTLNQIKFLSKNSIYYGSINGDAIQYESLGPKELVIRLYTDPLQPKPNLAYLQELTFPILPKHVLAEYTPPQILLLSNTEFGRHPIGSGKFKYRENEGVALALDRNDNYFGDKVRFDNYNLRLYQDLDSLVKDYTLKKVHIFTRKDIVEKDNIDLQLNALGAKNYTTILKNRNLALYFNLNYKEKETSPFTRSISLRQNLLKVLDRTNIIKSVNNIGREVYGPIDQDSWAFLQEVREQAKPDLASFTKILEDTGYKKNGDYYEKDGLKLGFKLTYLVGETRDKVANEIQAQLKSAGIEVVLNKIGDFDPDSKEMVSFNPRVEIEKLNNVVTSRDFEVLLTTINQYQDPDRFNEWHSSRSASPGINLSGFNSAKADAYLVEGRLETDTVKRKDAYLKFQKVFIQEVPAIYLMNQGISTYYSPDIKNVERGMINDIEYKYERISQWEVE
jgi:peptide/nickel transport system substrate-binding protein